jgi:hypothetical protein
MRKLLQGIAVAVMLFAIVGGGNGNATAVDDAPHTFLQCVTAWGEVSFRSGEMSCRRVDAYDLRIYGTAPNEQGTPMPVEIWSETYVITVTYPMQPGRTKTEEVLAPGESCVDGWFSHLPACEDQP